MDNTKQAEPMGTPGEGVGHGQVEKNQDPTLCVSHGTSLAHHSPEVLGVGIGLFIRNLTNCGLHVAEFTLASSEVTVVLYQEEVEKASQKLPIYTPKIPLLRWAEHLLALAVVTSERQLALETAPIAPTAPS